MWIDQQWAVKVLAHDPSVQRPNVLRLIEDRPGTWHFEADYVKPYKVWGKPEHVLAYVAWNTVKGNAYLQSRYCLWSNPR